MASSVEEKVQEATDELHARKQSEGVDVKTPEKSIVRKAVSSIDEDMEFEDPETDADALDEQPPDLEENRAVEVPEGETRDPVSEQKSSGSLVSRIKSFFTSKSSPDRLEAEPVGGEKPDIGSGLEEIESPEEELEEPEDEDTVDSPEDIGEVESLDELEEGHIEKDIEDDPEAELALQEELGIDTTGYDEEEIEPGQHEAGSEDQADTEDTAETFEEPEELEEQLDDIKDTGPETPESGNLELLEEAEEPQADESQVDESTVEEESVDSEDDPEPSMSERRDVLEENLNDLEDKIANGEVEQRREELRERIAEIEEKMVSTDSRELGKINELEQRVERLEMDDESDLEERIARLEDRIESIKTPQQLDDRLTELEDAVMNPDRRIRDVVDEELRGEIDDIKESVEREETRIEAEVERLADDQQSMEDSVDQLRDSLEELREETAGERVDELDDKFEQLWEAMDEELVSLEDGVHENEVDVDELMSTMVELTELVKEAMDQ